VKCTVCGGKGWIPCEACVKPSEKHEQEEAGEDGEETESVDYWGVAALAAHHGSSLVKPLLRERIEEAEKAIAACDQAQALYQQHLHGREGVPLRSYLRKSGSDVYTNLVSLYGHCGKLRRSLALLNKNATSRIEKLDEQLEALLGRGSSALDVEKAEVRLSLVQRELGRFEDMPRQLIEKSAALTEMLERETAAFTAQRAREKRQERLLAGIDDSLETVFQASRTRLELDQGVLVITARFRGADARTSPSTWAHRIANVVFPAHPEVDHIVLRSRESELGPFLRTEWE
jgi:hypothetical protein